MTINWGFVGTGGIARTVASALELAPGGRLFGVSSRSAERAADFARDNGAEHSFASVADLLAQPGLDAVYIATPHPQHHAAARAALEAGVSVLVEKPMTVTLAAAEDLVQLARSRSVFLMEAYWTRFLPGTAALLEVLTSGAIGDVQVVHADLGMVVDSSVRRFFDPAIGGGSLLDLGPYPVGLAHTLLGAPQRVQAVGSLTPQGVDRQMSLALSYASGAVAALSTTMVAQASRRAWIEGTAGWIEVDGPLHLMPRFTVHTGEDTAVHEHSVAHGHRFMLEHVHDCLERGLTESPLMPLERSLAVMNVFEQALDQVGVVRHHELAEPGKA